MALAAQLTPRIVAATMKRARFIKSSGNSRAEKLKNKPGDYSDLHFSVPVFGLGVDRAEDFHVPLAAAPRLDHFGRYDVDEDLGEEAPFRVALEVVRRLVPPEVRIEHQRQKQIVPVVDDDQLA